jgi:hypothetical protein
MRLSFKVAKLLNLESPAQSVPNARARCLSGNTARATF